MAEVNEKPNSLHIAQDLEQFDYDEAITLSTSYATVLTIRCKKVRESVITFKNDDASIDMDYKIFGTTKKNPDFTDIDSDEWINLISAKTKASSSTYDHTESRPLDADTRWYESFSNTWTAVIVQMKADSGTPTAKIWHRGQN